MEPETALQWPMPCFLPCTTTQQGSISMVPLLTALLGRGGWEGRKAVSGSQQLWRTLISLQCLFFSPWWQRQQTVVPFCYLNWFPWWAHPFRTRCNVNFWNDQKASKLRKCCTLRERGEGFRGIGNDLLFFKNLGHPPNAVIFKQFVF